MQHVTQTTVCKGGTKDGDVVLVGPVKDRRFIIDFLAQSCDDCARCPDHFLLVASLSAGSLLGE